jgi:hypothetical protein
MGGGGIIGIFLSVFSPFGLKGNPYEKEEKRAAFTKR